MMEAKPPQFLSLQQEAANEKTSGDRLEKLAKNSPSLGRLVASNPSAPPALLQKLAGTGDAPTRKNVAANPNTPAEVLLQLGAEFPEELLNNPVFSLLLLENPHVAEQMPSATIASLVKREPVPLFVWEAAAKRNELKEILLEVANNPKTPLAILEKLAKSASGAVQQAAQLHVNLAGEMTERWEPAARKEICKIYFYDKIGAWKLSHGASLVSPYQQGIEVLEKLGAIPELLISSLPEIAGYFPRMASNPNTAGSILAQLAKESDCKVRSAVGKNPNTPVSVLEMLAKDSDWMVRSEVAKNINLPVSILEKLAKDGDFEVRTNVALNTNMPVSLLVQLAKDICWRVTAGVASNANTPVSLLVELAKDSNAAVRSELAKNPNTPVSLLVEWGKDSNVLVRSELAKNPNTPVSLLVELAKDSNAAVRSELAKNPNTPVSLLVELGKDSNVLVRSELAKNPNTPVILLVRLAKDRDWKVRAAVAKNPNTPVSVLKKLAKDRDVSVRSQVAINLNTPVSLLVQLAKDSNWLIRDYLAKKSNTPVSVLEQLLGAPEETILQIAVGRYLAKNPDGLPVVLQHYPKDSTPEYSSPKYSRLVILLHPQVPSTVLAAHSRSLAWWYRYAVAQHPNTQPDALETLAGDANRLVRAAARANLQNRQIQG
ncbi:HEAT repeat domain-containing protein [Kamptonema formosum]|uniref:HEAT repeat domain-containing protein n=1 Tax=Kamptonema formosum TaxID=331992 RepID=UPI000344FF46|nr:hypothetical protein [Oscillatoria sp. PCC 10802]